MGLDDNKISKFVNKIICGDCRDVLAKMPSNSIHSVITSPP